MDCFSLRKADVKSLDFAVVRFLMKLFSSTNINIVNNCRWHFDFQLPCEVLEKKKAKFERKFADCKTYTVISVFWHNLVTHKVYFVHTVTN